MEQSNLGETASWITEVENSKVHMLVNTSYSIGGTVERREPVKEKKW